jgi:methanogenic corrinoid protein MtbC1
MDKFSIAQLSRYSGIKAHTIRIWEQRYKALVPHRSDGNTRYYDSSHLRRLLNIVSLIDGNHKVSQLCELSDPELFRLVNERISQSIHTIGPTEYYISQLIAAGMTYDEKHFHKIFDASLVNYGITDAYINVIYPMLVRVGMMWTGDKMPPANEHFVTNLVRQKLFAALESLTPANDNAPSWLLFLKEDEYHELGILFANYLVRASGKRVLYLGCDVPVHSVIAAFRSTQPQYALIFIVRREEPEQIKDYFQQISRAFKGKTIYVAGHEFLAAELNLNGNIKLLKSVAELDTELSLI